MILLKDLKHLTFFEESYFYEILFPLARTLYPNGSPEAIDYEQYPKSVEKLLGFWSALANGYETEPAKIFRKILFGIGKDHLFVNGNKRLAVMCLVALCSYNFIIPKEKNAQNEKEAFHLAFPYFENDFWQYNAPNDEPLQIMLYGLAKLVSAGDKIFLSTAELAHKIEKYLEKRLVSPKTAFWF